jgi:hypothetical protein
MGTVGSIDTELRLVQLIFRHGDRTPINMFPGVTQNETIWDKYGGLGQLTQKGMKEMLNFGEFLRVYYRSFLNKYYLESEIDAISTDFDRTIMSCNMLLAGLYKPIGYQKLVNNLNWQPIPVHMNNERTRRMFNDKSCPKLEKLRREAFETGDYKNLIEENRGLVRMMKKKIDNKDFSFNQIWPLGDTLFIERRNNLKLADWITEFVYNRVLNISDSSFDYIFRELETAKLTAGGILNEFYSNIKEKIKGNRKQIHLYSSHDSYIAPMIKLLGISSHIKQPPFASAIILELRQSANKNYFVQVLWKNTTTSNQFQTMAIDGCDKLCPYEDFIKIIKSKIVDNFEFSCKLN